MKKILCLLLCSTLYVGVLTGCSDADKNNPIETETIENEAISGETWTSDEFLAQFKTFEDNLRTFLSICCAVNYSYDDEEAKEHINFWLKYAETPVPLYVVWKTYQFETELGTKFERSDNEYYDYIPKDMVKDMILLLYNIDEDKIKWEDFKFLENEKKPGYFEMATAFSAGYYDADILYDTLIYSPETNIVTFNVKFYELGREPKEQFELCTFKYEFRTFLYKDKIQGYQFIDVKLI